MDATVWVVEDEASLRWVMQQALGDAGYRVATFGAVTDALTALKQSQPTVIVTDVRLPDASGFDLLSKIQDLDSSLPVVIVTAYSDFGNSMAAYNQGAFEYLPKPFDIDELVRVVTRAIESRAHDSAQDIQSAPDGDALLIGDSVSMQPVFRAIGRLASTNLPVLITGESGTGKEVVARALHENSPWRHGPFVAMNTAAIPEQLLESELFGHEKGAFTGAFERRRGRIEQAQNGTLFLDEIGDMPAVLQTRLLRVLSEGEYYRLGSSTPKTVRTRIVAATHRKLEEEVAAGRFREDLFHRLNVVPIHVPALRERRDDIPLLVDHCLRQAERKLALPKKQITGRAIRHLKTLDWPGNVRELENLCLRLTVLCPGQSIDLDDLPGSGNAGGSVGYDWTKSLSRWVAARLEVGDSMLWQRVIDMVEKQMIAAALAACDGKKSAAAARLGIGRNTLSRKLTEKKGKK